MLHSALDRLHRLIFPNIEPYGLHLTASSEPEKPGFFLRDAGVGIAQGDRPYQRDRHRLVLPNEIQSEDSTGDELAFFAIFDGHGTDRVSEHASKHFHKQLMGSASLQTGRYEDAIKEVVKKEEEALLKGYFQKGVEDYATSGSTFSACVVNLSKGILVVGNIGDSPIVLAECKPGSKKVRKTKHLTESHTPSRPDEKHRIQKAGGKVNYRTGCARIGKLNVSRSLGDLEYKTPINQKGPGPTDTANSPVSWAPPEKRSDFVSSELSFKRINLSPESFYILAVVTDGVTESVNDEDLMWSISHMAMKGYNAGVIANDVVSKCSRWAGSDNATCITAFLNSKQAEAQAQARGRGHGQLSSRSSSYHHEM